MGIGVSDWRLARAVALTGQLGVVSGTALAHVFARRLQLGDGRDELRRALEAFPAPDVVRRVLERLERRAAAADERGARFGSVPMYTLAGDAGLTELTVLANFVEIFLAKQGHDGPVGLNLLEKVQLPNLPSLYGAMLAGADYVLMGAGVPRAIPGVLDALARHEEVSLAVDVAGDAAGSDRITFSPARLAKGLRPLARPRFLAIVSSDVLATVLVKKASGRIDGFVIEGATAGGHNAPPRGGLQLDADGQPVYGERDAANLERFRALERPFWLAGSYATPDKLREARRAGAQGVQVGTAFAFCRESGLRDDLRQLMVEKSARREVRVRTSPRSSPTGLPFKVAAVESSLSDAAHYEARTRICDLGYLRRPYRADDGGLGYRCPAEPEHQFAVKAGDPGDTDGRHCLCNALLANVGLGQRRASGYEELPLLTAGDDLQTIARFLPPGESSYSAADVVRELLTGLDGTDAR